MHPPLPSRARRDARPGPGWPRAGGEGARAASARSEWGPWWSDRTGDIDSSISAVTCPVVARMLPSSRIRSAPPGQGRDSASRAVTARGGEETMQWETPECIEIKMDAELSSYQEG